MDYKVLVVDDSKVSRMFISNYCRQLQPDWQIFEAQDGEQALQLAGQHQFYLITLDYNMPGMSGLDTAAALKTTQPDCFIGLLTANVQRSTQEDAQAAGIWFYKKPVNLELVRQILQEVEAFYGAV